MLRPPLAQITKLIVPGVILALLCCTLNASARDISRSVYLPALPERPLGDYFAILKEPAGHPPLTWQEAWKLYVQGDFTPSRKQVISEGLGSAPIWLALEITNDTATSRQLLIDAAWLDHIEVVQITQGALAQHHHSGDALPFGSRNNQYSGFDINLSFGPGHHLLLLRIETPDPMFAPIYLLTDAQRDELVAKRLFSYGIGYGYILALMFYNILLYVGLRDRRHVFYALYLAAFVCANVGYTGHGFAWIWPDATAWQRWGQSILMGLFGTTALIFSVEFLDIRKNWRNGFYWVLGTTCVYWLYQVATISFHSHRFSIAGTFVFMLVFTLLMLAQGFHQLRGQPINARYYLCAVAAGTMGTIVTTLTTMGWLPPHELGFRAVELGMLVEATLLALALAARFRVTQQEHAKAQHNANTDELTGLLNRRALKAQLDRLWAEHQRHGHPLSIVIMDIDHFKEVNDQYGHIGGDQVLKHIGTLIKDSIRREDVAARWGGEEFLIAMPHSPANGAMDFAERLRERIEQATVTCNTGGRTEVITVTASLGIAQCTLHETTIEQPIIRADKALYQAKIDGRNRSLAWNAQMKNRNRVLLEE